MPKPLRHRYALWEGLVIALGCSPVAGELRERYWFGQSPVKIDLMVFRYLETTSLALMAPSLVRGVLQSCTRLGGDSCLKLLPVGRLDLLSTVFSLHCQHAEVIPGDMIEMGRKRGVQHGAGRCSDQWH